MQQLRHSSRAWESRRCYAWKQYGEMRVAASTAAVPTDVPGRIQPYRWRPHNQEGQANRRSRHKTMLRSWSFFRSLLELHLRTSSLDRKRVVWGKGVSVSVYLGG